MLSEIDNRMEDCGDGRHVGWWSEDSGWCPQSLLIEVKPHTVMIACCEVALMTDESSLYTEVGAEFASHETVCHSAGEYVREDIHTNTMDGYWGLFKRGMKGIYQHCAEKHLHRYLAEFDFRYNGRVALGVGDRERTANALQGARGKRLMYRQPRDTV